MKLPTVKSKPKPAPPAAKAPGPRIVKPEPKQAKEAPPKKPPQKTMVKKKAVKGRFIL